ncbi:MAG: hypothetical protein COA61_004340 [Zetaproteobacteria bacterium]|nr:hypothetical protein [Zetaproteobacteria bacterium]
MKIWALLAQTTVEGEAYDMRLYQRGDEFSIKTGYSELMNSRMHSSEDLLAELGCRALKQGQKSRVLIGGLGMGYTLAAALKHAPDDAEIIVAELVPAVIEWNRTYLSHLANHPLKDKRVTVYEGDVGVLMRQDNMGFAAILLDVDNGPDGLTRQENGALYSAKGLKSAKAALRPHGILGVWSAFPEPRFTKKMKQAGFQTEEVACRAHGQRGSKHIVWLGVRP